jgi:hypothetical protein
LASGVGVNVNVGGSFGRESGSFHDVKIWSAGPTLLIDTIETLSRVSTECVVLQLETKYYDEHRDKPYRSHCIYSKYTLRLWKYTVNSINVPGRRTDSRHPFDGPCIIRNYAFLKRNA